jgi:hypothetical protein
MTRAPESALDGLHGLLAETLSDALKKAKAAGEAPSPQLLAQVIKFLKDNGIDAPAKSARISGLAAELADIDLDEVSTHGLRPN